MNADRIGSGLAAMGTLAWFMWPDEHWTFQPEPAVALATALAIWFWRELSHGSIEKQVESGSKGPHPHDTELAKRVRGYFDEETKRFLREHSFGVPFPDKAIKPLEAVAEWKGVDFHFEDRERDNKMFEVIRLTQELVEKIVNYSGYTRNGRFLSVPTDEERAHDIFKPHTHEHIRELDNLAAALLQAYENLEKEMRSKLPQIYTKSG
jgi:hypothetical protein